MASLYPQRVSEEAPPETWEERPAPTESEGEPTAAAESLLKPAADGETELASRLADAQAYLGRLELARLQQDLRIYELEDALQAEPSTRTPSLRASARTPFDVDASWLDDAHSRSASTEDMSVSSTTPRLEHTPQLALAARKPAGLQIRTEERWGDMDSQDGACSEMDGRGLSIPSTPELAFRQPRWERQDASLRSPVAMGPPSFHTLPTTSLQHFYPSCAMASPVAHHCDLVWYRVAFISGIEVRTEPDSNGPTAGVVLPQHSIFQAWKMVAGTDCRVYLKLADGRGWVFDDAALYPEDPSVVLMSPYELSSPCALPPPPTVSAGSILLSTTPASAPSAAGQCQVACYAAAVAPPPLVVFADNCGEDNEEVQEIPFDEDEDLEVEEEDLTGAVWEVRRGKRGGQKRRKRGGVKHRSKTES